MFFNEYDLKPPFFNKIARFLNTQYKSMCFQYGISISFRFKIGKSKFSPLKVIILSNLDINDFK
jgi:hypothetical protein